MKRVVSISLGSSERNGQALHRFGGYEFAIERIGTDGNKEKAIDLIQSLDGTVDAFGLGGTDLYIYAGNRRFMFRESARIARAAKLTPLVDGSGVKNTLERRVVDYLEKTLGVDFSSKKTLLVCAVDRFGLADALVKSGSQVVFGDLMFGLGIPLPLYSLDRLSQLASVIAPVITQLPISWFYPTGTSQTKCSPKFSKYFHEADIIAGDFHFIRRYAPLELQGKMIITNTVTKADERMLKERGVHILVTTTPEIGERSFGTNILEGMLVSLRQGTIDSISSQEYEDMLDQHGVEPRVKRLAD